MPIVKLSADPSTWVEVSDSEFAVLLAQGALWTGSSVAEETINIKTTMNPSVWITVTLTEYYDLLRQGLVAETEGGDPILYPTFTSAQYSEFETVAPASAGARIRSLMRSDADSTAAGSLGKKIDDKVAAEVEAIPVTELNVSQVNAAITDNLSAAAATAIAARPELSAAFVGGVRPASRLRADFYHDFTNKPDHVMADGDLSDSGHVFTVRENPQPPFRVSDGALTRTPSAGGVYLGTKLDGPVARIGCEYVIPEGAGIPDTLTLIASKLEFTAESDATGYSVAASHTNIGQTSITYQTLDSNPPEYNFLARTLLTYNHPTLLTPGRYTVEIDILGRTASVNTPTGGRITVPADDKILSQNGPWVTWELFAGASGTKALRIERIWAWSQERLEEVTQNRIDALRSGSVAGLKVTAVSPSSVSLAWDADERASGYQVYVFDGTSWSYGPFVSSITATVTGLSESMPYRFDARPVFSVTAVTSGSWGTLIAADDFERTDGAPGSTPTGALAWGSYGGGTLAISGGKLYATTVTTVANGLLGYVDPGHSDIELEFTYTAASGFGNGGAGIRYALTPSVSGIHVQVVSGNWAIERRTGASTYTTIHTSSKTAAIGQVVKVRTTASDNRILVWVDGQLIFDVIETVVPGSQRLAGMYARYSNRGFAQMSLRALT